MLTAHEMRGQRPNSWVYRLGWLLSAATGAYKVQYSSWNHLTIKLTMSEGRFIHPRCTSSTIVSASRETVHVSSLSFLSIWKVFSGTTQASH